MAVPCAPKVEVGQRRDGKVEIVEGIGGSDYHRRRRLAALRDGAAVRLASGGSRRWRRR